MNNKNHTKEQFETETDVLEQVTPSLVLFNDDVNTFEHVIDCLQKICAHTVEQATQASILVHHKGKCVVKNDAHDQLKPMCHALLDAGLSAKIMD